MQHKSTYRSSLTRSSKSKVNTLTPLILPGMSQMWCRINGGVPKEASGKRLRTGSFLGSAFLLGVLGVADVVAADTKYEVTVHNLTRGELAKEGDVCRTGQQLGLLLFATHRADVKLFELGKTASPELATLAETGAPFLLANVLSANPGVGQVFTVPDVADFPAELRRGIICPGENLAVTVDARPGQGFLSMAAMIAPTNDGFIALNGVRLPSRERSIELHSPAYDAGSESNDELCVNIPGVPGLPGCHTGDHNSNPNIPDPHPEGGPGIGEGYVHPPVA